MDDALDVVVSFLTAGWIPDNTDDMTPIIKRIFDVRKGTLSNGDYILIYPTGTPSGAFGLGGDDWYHKPNISIDIRSTNKISTIENIRPHLWKLVEEVRRIIKVNVTVPTSSDYQVLRLRPERDLSNKSIGMGRVVNDIQLEHYGS